MTQDQHKLEPCPFCGFEVTDSRKHAEDCYFVLFKKLNDAPQADTSLLPRVLSAWNRRAHLQQRPLPVRELTPELNDVLQFLYGAEPLDGVWLGGRPDGEPPYWWRPQLRKAIQAAFASPSLPVRQEPTPEQIAAGVNAMRYDGWHLDTEELVQTMPLVYRAMVSTSPSVQNMGEWGAPKDGVQASELPSATVEGTRVTLLADVVFDAPKDGVGGTDGR